MKTSSTPLSASSDRFRSITGRPPTTSIGFGTVAPSDSSRVPLPAASTTAFTEHLVSDVGDRPLDPLAESDARHPSQRPLALDVRQRHLRFAGKVVLVNRAEARLQDSLDDAKDLVDRVVDPRADVEDPAIRP